MYMGKTQQDAPTRVEELTSDEIRARLRAAGIHPGSAWQGYERAKALILGNTWIDPDEYDRRIATICRLLMI